MDQKIKLLVVDDEQIVRISCERSLSNTQYEITTAATPGEGLKLMEGTAFDIVITDYKMPCMDGMEFINEAKKITQNIRLILVTGFATQEAMDQARDMGALFLAKPFTPKELLEVLNQVQ